MYSNITILGTLTRDPELKSTKSGTPMTTLNLAVNRGEAVTWFRVPVFGKMAENAVKYLAKGRGVMVSGALIPSENGSPAIWQDNEGKAHATYEIWPEQLTYSGRGSFQSVTVLGHLGGNPELRYTQTGKAVCSFSLAAKRVWTKDGERQEQTIWYRCSAWERQAELINQYLEKGAQIMVRGRLNPDENGNPRVFQTNDGRDASSFELTVEEFSFVNDKKAEGSQEEAQEEHQEEQGQALPF